MNAEINDRKWFYAGILLQLAVGYVLSFLIYFFGSLILKVELVSWMVILGFSITLLVVFVICCLIFKNNKKTKSI